MTCFCTPCHEKALKQVLCVLACDNDVGQTFQTEFEKDEPLVAYRDAVCLEVQQAVTRASCQKIHYPLLLGSLATSICLGGNAESSSCFAAPEHGIYRCSGAKAGSLLKVWQVLGVYARYPCFVYNMI